MMKTIKKRRENVLNIISLVADKTRTSDFHATRFLEKKIFDVTTKISIAFSLLNKVLEDERLPNLETKCTKVNVEIVLQTKLKRG